MNCCHIIKKKHMHSCASGPSNIPHYPSIQNASYQKYKNILFFPKQHPYYLIPQYNRAMPKKKTTFACAAQIQRHSLCLSAQIITHIKHALRRALSYNGTDIIFANITRRSVPVKKKLSNRDCRRAKSALLIIRPWHWQTLSKLCKYKIILCIGLNFEASITQS